MTCLIEGSKVAERQAFPTGFWELCSFKSVFIYLMISISDTKAIQCLSHRKLVILI